MHFGGLSQFIVDGTPQAFCPRGAFQISDSMTSMRRHAPAAFQHSGHIRLPILRGKRQSRDGRLGYWGRALGGRLAELEERQMTNLCKPGALIGGVVPEIIPEKEWYKKYPYYFSKLELRRARQEGIIGSYRCRRGYGHTAQQIADYLERKRSEPCKDENLKLMGTGSPKSGGTGTGLGLTPEVAKLAASHSAQRITKPVKSG